MVKRKSAFDEKREKIRAMGPLSRRVSKKLDVDALPNAVEDGVLIPKKGDEVIFERTKEGTITTCIGTIISIYDEGGVDVWDETHHEFFLFNVKHVDKVKVKIAP